MTELERRYRRLLALYPRDHRERTGGEMLGVLMSAAGDRTRPGFRDTADLLWTAARLHLRRMLAAEGVDARDVLAIVSLLGPIVLLSEAVPGVREVAWHLKHGVLPGRIPDAPLWAAWLVVGILVLRRWRVAAAIGAWGATAGFVLLEFSAPYDRQWTSLDAGWVLLGFLTAVGLTFSPGPSRGLELVGLRGVFVMAASVAVLGLFAVLGFSGLAEQWPWLVLLSASALWAAGHETPVGRRAALVLSVPLIPVLLWNTFGDWEPEVNMAVFYGSPLLLLLAVGGLPRSPRRRTA